VPNHGQDCRPSCGEMHEVAGLAATEDERGAKWFNWITPCRRFRQAPGSCEGKDGRKDQKLRRLAALYQPSSRSNDRAKNRSIVLKN